MDTIISGRHTELSAGLRSHVEKQFKHLDRFNRDVTRARVTLTRERTRCIAEAELSVRGAAPFYAEAEAGEFRSAVDRLVDKLSIQLRKARSRSRAHRGPEEQMTPLPGLE